MRVRRRRVACGVAAASAAVVLVPGCSAGTGTSTTTPTSTASSTTTGTGTSTTAVAPTRDADTANCEVDRSRGRRLPRRAPAGRSERGDRDRRRLRNTPRGRDVSASTHQGQHRRCRCRESTVRDGSVPVHRALRQQRAVLGDLPHRFQSGSNVEQPLPECRHLPVAVRERCAADGICPRLTTHCTADRTRHVGRRSLPVGPREERRSDDRAGQRPSLRSQRTTLTRFHRRIRRADRIARITQRNQQPDDLVAEPLTGHHQRDARRVGRDGLGRDSPGRPRQRHRLRPPRRTPPAASGPSPGAPRADRRPTRFRIAATPAAVARRLRRSPRPVDQCRCRCCRSS